MKPIHGIAGSARTAMQFLLASCLVLTFVSCSSPLELDVDRDVRNIDNIVSPSRLSMYYYFGNQGYEAIVTNEALLKSILIDQSTYPCKITIPQFLFTLSATDTATPAFTPFIRTFSFSSIAEPADGFFRNAVNKDSWITGDYIDITNAHQEFNWMADNSRREIRIAYYTVADEKIVKGFIQFLLLDPATPRHVTFRALLTMEYN